MGFEIKTKITTFGGQLLKLTHQSTSTKTVMNVSVFVPGGATPSSPAPVLLFLSGLTCTPDNCSEKGYVHAAASRRGIAVVYPDTSPRGAGIAGEDDAYDFGTGAGFYVDATRAPWSANYNMYTYVRHELLEALFSPDFTAGTEELAGRLDGSRVSVTGHSMGGHGALTLYLRNPGLFRSVSALAPISNPTRCPWGRKAFSGYFGDEDTHGDAWRRHDATELIAAGAADAWEGRDLRALIDVGTGDDFYKQGQLLPENLEKAVADAGVTGVTVRYHENYDHSYYFVSSFAEAHVEHAAKYLL